MSSAFTALVDDVSYPKQRSPFTQAQINASLAANPQGTFGPSPQVDYSPFGDQFASGGLNFETKGDQPASSFGERVKAAQFYDPSIDYLKGLKEQQMGKLKAGTLEQQKRRLLAFGSRELAAKILGENDPFLSQISDDPTKSTSWMAEANRRLRQLLSQTSENLGHSYGLWNSSGRTNALSDLGREHQVAVARESEAVQDDLAAMQSTLTQAESDWMQRLFDAQKAAWQAGATNHGF
jgi:hypothetical protein